MRVGTAQRWDGHFQADLKFSERSFWFGAVRYEDDRYSGFQYQSSFSTDAVVNAALSYEHSFNPSTKIIEAFLIEPGQSNTMLKDSVSLR